MDKYSELKELITKASPRPWYAASTSRDPSDEYDFPPEQMYLGPFGNGDSTDAIAWGYEGRGIDEQQERDFNLIAAAVNAIGEILSEVEQLRADAARWRYVRDNHVRSMSLHMDGSSEFRLGGHLLRAHSAERAVDRCIAASKEGSQSDV